jgi:spermidine synthase
MSLIIIQLKSKFIVRLKETPILMTNSGNREKLDKTGYEHLVTKNIKEFENELDNHTPNIHKIVQGTSSVLVNAAKKNSKQRTYGKNVLKLKCLNQDITEALKANKTAYKEWKEANSPMDI